MSTIYQEGQIYFADKKKYPGAKHPIVFMGPYDKRPGFYIGLMLTKDKGKDKAIPNLPMMVEHFSPEFNFQRTHVVSKGILKPEEWVLYEDKGRLSEKGLEFVRKNISFDDLKEWSSLVPTGI